MILALRQPIESVLKQYVLAQAGEQFTYPEVGASAGDPPEGYDHDTVRRELGRGDDVFRAAEDAVGKWAHFETGWTRIYPPDAEVIRGQTVAVLARVYGLWSVHACRIIEVIHEKNRRGFIYGTLPGHGETGEERFLVERRDDGSVWYEINAFFRPFDWRVRVLWPLIKPHMGRFRRESADAVQRSVQGQATGRTTR
jgi:uncharacterized protein (UPF0548 family)